MQICDFASFNSNLRSLLLLFCAFRCTTVHSLLDRWLTHPELVHPFRWCNTMHNQGCYPCATCAVGSAGGRCGVTNSTLIAPLNAYSMHGLTVYIPSLPLHHGQYDIVVCKLGCFCLVLQAMYEHWLALLIPSSHTVKLHQHERGRPVIGWLHTSCMCPFTCALQVFTHSECETTPSLLKRFFLWLVFPGTCR